MSARFPRSILGRWAARAALGLLTLLASGPAGRAAGFWWGPLRTPHSWVAVCRTRPVNGVCPHVTQVPPQSTFYVEAVDLRNFHAFAVDATWGRRLPGGGWRIIWRQSWPVDYTWNFTWWRVKGLPAGVYQVQVEEQLSLATPVPWNLTVGRAVLRVG